MSSKKEFVDQFKKAKLDLRNAECTIRRLTGRDPDEVMGTVSGSRRQSSSAASRSFSRPSFSSRKVKPFTSRKRSRERDQESSYESSSDESPSKKPAILSTVVATSNPKRSRKATIDEQNANSKLKDRNRRMFGAIVATLASFEKEEKNRQLRESKRAEIEQKVEAATEEERERIKKEKEHLFVTRKEKQIELRCLEKKIERADCHEAFEANQQHLMNFIRTKSKPHLYYLPKSHNSESKKKLEESRSKIRATIKKRNDFFNKDLAEIEEWYKKDSSKPSTENNQLKEESESYDVPEREAVVEQQEDPGNDSNPNSVSNPVSNSNSESKANDENEDEDEEDSNNTKNIGSLEDEDFEPIYD